MRMSQIVTLHHPVVGVLRQRFKMIFKKLNLKKYTFIFFTFFLSSASFGVQNELGEDLKGECIATLPDQSRSELLDIKLDLEDLEAEDSSGTTETKSK